MHGDLRDTGVTVQLANPGYIDTRMQDDNPPFEAFHDDAGRRPRRKCSTI